MTVIDELLWQSHAEAAHETGGEAPPRVDVHQHIWTDGLCAALAERTDTPRLRRSGRVWILQLAGEPAFEMPPAESADQRTAVLDDLGLDVGIVALSAALGAEELPEHEARRLISAWDDDADALPERLPAWGSLPLRLPDPADVDAALDRGRVGITIPATALSGPAAVDHLGPVLERLAERDAPLFVHPGPSAPGTWLPALTSYVASLSTAWHAWALYGREHHPRLRVLFAALAGLAPLHVERLRARVPAADARAALGDEHLFYETSSYGPRAQRVIAELIAPTAIVHGTDWPYAARVDDARTRGRLALQQNPAILLGRTRRAVVA